MVIRKKWVAQVIFQVLIYLGFIAIFITFYMKDQLTDFFQGRTTTSSKFVEVEAYQIPTMIFCLNPGTKATVADKHYNLSNVFDVFSYIETFSEVFEDISYILTKAHCLKITRNVSFNLFSSWHSPPFFVFLKCICLLTMFDHMLRAML